MVGFLRIKKINLRKLGPVKKYENIFNRFDAVYARIKDRRTDRQIEYICLHFVSALYLALVCVLQQLDYTYYTYYYYCIALCFQ